MIHFLKERPNNRDNDGALIANIWQRQIMKIKQVPSAEFISGFDVLQLIASNKISKAESIRRIRQKVQEEIPELRGKNYQKRQKHSVQVRQAINQNQSGKWR